MKEDTLKELSLSEIIEESENLLSEFKDTMLSLEEIVSELKELQSND